MTEAYEIGISLALRDGVSESIGIARRDMAAIEAAIARSGVPLQKLHEAAAGVGRANKAKPPIVSHVEAERPQTAKLEPGANVSPGDVESEAASPVKISVHPALRAPSTLRDRNGLKQAPETSRYAPALEVAPVGSTIARPTEPDQSPWRTIRPESLRDPDEPSQQQRRVVGTEKPTAAYPAAEPRRSPEAESGPVTGVRISQAPPSKVSVRLAPEKESGVSGTLARVRPASSHESLALPYTQNASTHQRRDSGVVASSPQAGTVPAQRARAATAEAGPAEASSPQIDNTPMLAPASVEPGDGAVAPVGFGRYDPPRRAAARDTDKAAEPAHEPSAPSNDHGPVEGDVYLDGALVGRWLARHMAREAGRPGVGPTGFDARRSPLRPGTTIGD